MATMSPSVMYVLCGFLGTGVLGLVCALFRTPPCR